MKGRDFLDLAQEIVGVGSERHWRGAFIHAYYALLLEARDALLQWGISLPPRQAVHAEVRLRLTYSANSDVRDIGLTLDRLAQRRAWASYVLQPHSQFGSESAARNAIHEAASALASLDAIDSDPNQRATVIADIRARWP